MYVLSPLTLSTCVFLKKKTTLFIFGCFGSLLLRAGFLSWQWKGLLSFAVHRLLTVVASRAVEHRFQARGLQYLQHRGSVVVVFGPWSSWVSVAVSQGLSSCGTWALVAHAMWNLPGPGIKPMSPALAGGFPSSVPPGKLSFKYCYPPSIWTQFQTQLGFQKSN